jgi:hypothetical protein
MDQDVQFQDNQKIENEAKLMNMTQTQEVQKRKQHYFGNDEKNEEKDSHRNNSTKTPEEAIDNAQLPLLQAEYNAALEKHRRLLLKLQRGGHDTEKLENKFNEFRTKCRSMGVNVGNDASPTNAKTAVNSKNRKDDNDVPSKPGAKQKQQQQRKQQPPQQEFEYDRQHRHRQEESDDGSQVDQSKLKQLFNLLREDTNDMPIEMTEENVKLLLKKVAKNPELMNNNNNTSNKGNQSKDKENNKFSTRTIEKQKVVTPQEPKKKRVGVNERPKWGYKNLEGKKMVPNSQKDPFHKERQNIADERRQLQIDQLKALIELNNQKSQKRYSPMDGDDDDVDDENEEVINVRKHALSQSRQAPERRQQQQQQSSSSNTKQESIMNLLNNRNLRNKPIYEEDNDNDNDDLYNKNRAKTNTQRRLKQSRQNDDDSGKNSNMGFVPFMRTDEFLDPAHAASPVPASRESTATNRNREKARQVGSFFFLCVFKE